MACIAAQVAAQGDIDLTGYTLVFEDEFDGDRVSVAEYSPKGDETYMYWPPYGAAGGYSASVWDADTIYANDGVMQMFAEKRGDQWYTGNISSMDSTAVGFSQTWGYFEVRAKMPESGRGAWPAFWLMSENSIHNNRNGTSLPSMEIDVFEWYGVEYDNNGSLIQQASHNWIPSGGPKGLYSPGTPMPNQARPWEDFHIYGAQVDPEYITWYIDGVQTNQIETPTDYIQSPFYFMIDYALGGGWGTSGVVEGSHFDVDWVRVWDLPDESIPGDYDSNGAVELADYLLWRERYGRRGWVADGNGDGSVDAADYAIWRVAYAEATGGLQASPAPAPTAHVLGLSVSALAGIAPGRLRRRRSLSASAAANKLPLPRS